MRFLLKFGLRLVINGIILWFLPQFLMGFSVSRVWPAILMAALAITLAHTFLRPILKVISFPFLILTLGLFNIVINYIVLLAADYFSAEITIAGFKAHLIASIIFGLANSLF